ncbi:hypothetical protein [Methylobacterium oryzihabitans]|uniref:Lectin-like protein BA14k n=1 Tax=Methylobacterium oryzihabitans TaxID=2499852 RepID=A0A3S2V9V4_9HYPH|nr:hypothetical protein [Methylobacterium oryzihabitans]RVU19332.1 hypothetical protein EOE48_07985 [Methylobacterium oryzihabitans]
MPAPLRRMLGSAFLLLGLAAPALAQGGLVTNPFASNYPSRPVRPAPATATPLVLPDAVDPRHAALPEGEARRRTCLERYRANRAAGTGNGGLRWTQKGGGYYAACNRRLAG